MPVRIALKIRSECLCNLIESDVLIGRSEVGLYGTVLISGVLFRWSPKRSSAQGANAAIGNSPTGPFSASAGGLRPAYARVGDLASRATLSGWFGEIQSNSAARVRRDTRSLWPESYLSKVDCAEPGS